jgi:putative transposase
MGSESMEPQLHARMPRDRSRYGISSRQVTRTLERVIEERGAPRALRCDNGPERTIRHFIGWCADKGIELVHIQPGRPMQNGHVESFNGRFRDECLNANWFVNLADARGRIEHRRQEYHVDGLHSSLDYRAPQEFAAQFGFAGLCSIDRGKEPRTPAPCPRPPSPLVPDQTGIEVETR